MSLWPQNKNATDRSEVVGTLGPKLYRYFVYHGCGDESSDCVQNVLLRLFKLVQSEKFEESKGSLIQLAFGVASNVLKERRRFGKKNQWQNLEDIQNLPNTSFAQNSTTQVLEPWLNKSMATLSSSEQQLLTLSFIDDLSHQAIAEISGVPLGSIKSTIRRALLKIRKKLDPNTSCQPTETKMFYEVTADEKS